MVIYALAEALPAVSVTNHLGFQMEHIKYQFDDDFFQNGKLFAGQKVFPFCDSLACNGKVLCQCVANQPAGADAQKMVDSIRGIIRHYQFLLKRGKGVFAKALVNALMLRQFVIVDRCHVGLFIREMLHRMPFEKFNSLLACPLAVFFVFFQCK